MKFCYVDESGMGEEPFAVMVGIIVDAQRMSLTKRHWRSLLKDLSAVVGRQITEIHTRDFYSGNGPWRTLDGTKRSQIITLIFNWLQERKHLIVYSAVDKQHFLSNFKNEPLLKDIPSYWCFLAFHLTLSLQKLHQRERNNKGNTVLIFDNENNAVKDFTCLTDNPPTWSNEYYEKASKQEPLDQLIDSPYFGDSKYIGLIQVADFICYFLRRYIELKENLSIPAYPEEEAKVTQWVEMAISRAIPKSYLYPSRGRSECSDLFWRYAPDCIKSFT